VILGAAYGGSQQSAHYPVTVQTCHSQNHLLPYMMLSECDATTDDIITTHTDASNVYLLVQNTTTTSKNI